MATQYFCKDPSRREKNAEDGGANLNGIDYVEVLDHAVTPPSMRQRKLRIQLLKPAEPGLVTAECIRISGGVSVRDIRVVSVEEEVVSIEEPPLSGTYEDFAVAVTATTDHAGDFSTYRLRLHHAANKDNPIDDFDPVLSEVDFSFKAECPSDFDCQAELECPPEPAPSPPALDYLAKDYASFRQLMLDRLAVVIPEWEDRIAPDVGVAVIETLAFAADRLSYYQDAVANEAYLGTARKRISLRRHARLLDYRMHEGCNARTWVQVQVSSDLTLGPGTKFLTKVPGLPTGLGEGTTYEKALQQGAEVFETMHGVSLYPQHNAIEFYTWGDNLCCLPRGATEAALEVKDGLDLSIDIGDVLLLEETLCPTTGQAIDADPDHRHAVRLTAVGGKETDAVTGKSFVRISWDEADALPFPLCLEIKNGNGNLPSAAIARGNIVLADHGRRIGLDERETITIGADPHERHRLSEPYLTHAAPMDERELPGSAWIEDGNAPTLAAAALIAQDPRKALPQIKLDLGADKWTAQRDLLDSEPFDKHFVAEIDEERTAWIRFGDDLFGERPSKDDAFTVTYRVGNGVTGNVSAGAIQHVVATGSNAIDSVSNPLPAVGGVDPERMEQVRLDAPFAFRTQERAVTPEDYAEMAMRLDGVQRAEASRRWTGSWYTIFLTVDRFGGEAVDDPFEAKLRDHLEAYRLACHDLEVEPPSFVPLEIEMTVCVEPGYYRSDVEEELLGVFGARDLPDGRRGVFHPDNFTFGQPVYLSPLIARAMEVPGVRWVEVDRFQRQGETSRGELDRAVLEVDRLEIVRLDSDPNRPENGVISFAMEGGQ